MSLAQPLPTAPAPSPPGSNPFWRIQEPEWAIGVPLLELLLVTLVLVAVGVLASWVVRLAPALRAGDKAAIGRGVRAGLRNLWFLLAVVITGYNGWLVWRGLSPRDHTLEQLRRLGPPVLWALGVAAVRLALAGLGVVLVARVARYVLKRVEDAINGWDRVQDNDQSLTRLFDGLADAVRRTGWLLWLVLAAHLLNVPDAVTYWLWAALRIYLIVATGVALVRSAGVVVDTLDGFSHAFAARRDWVRYYDHLRPLVPTFRASLEYVLWVAMGALVLAQVDTLRGLATWGPRVIQAIGIFLIGRIVVELGHFEIGHRLLPRAGLSEAERRRRGTMVPLLRSIFTYATYFAIAVLVLASLGFNPMPFLAGAGILGLVVGFGAQSLINDVVSGFFILFENVYLVGDTIESGSAVGVVEAIEFRTTKIRDAEGRLHVIRNADVGRIINYSREYALAVVTLEVGYDADIGRVFEIVREAGERIRTQFPAEALADLDLGGITRFGEKSLTVRASMRVQPGQRDALAAALRYGIKEGMERAGIAFPRPPGGPDRPPVQPAAV